MTRKERYQSIIDYFRTNVPVAESELDFKDAFSLLCAVMLSAQCTDKRVNMVTPALMEAYPTPADMAQASADDIFPYIRSISYPRNKAEHLAATARKLEAEFQGRVPSTVEELMTLPGVGRKTANVVASIIYNEPVIAVDTHVFRVSHRLGLSSGKTPSAVEKDLEKHIPEALRPIAHHWLILHGRYVCKALKPMCGECPLRVWCAHPAAE